jgi:F-type H+-transporting ATPase subunit delta
MLSATLRRATRLARAPRLARGMAEEAAAATGMTLNFTVPASAIYENVPAEMVLVPSVDGVFGILHNHVPTIAELKPGVVSITETEGATPKEYFVSGGFASIDANSVLNISALEAVPVEVYSAMSFAITKA